MTTRPKLQDEDLETMQFLQYREQVAQELDSLYLSHQSHLSPAHSRDTELTLTRALNRTRQRVLEKTAELQRLKSIYTDALSPSDPAPQDYVPLISSLQQSLSSALNSLYLEDNHTEVLINMQNRIRAGHLIMKNRFLYFEFALSKLNRRHRTAIESKRVASLCENLTRMEKGVYIAQRKASASEFRRGMEDNKETRGQLERDRGKSMDRMAGVRRKLHARTEERGKLLDTLRQNLQNHSSSQSLLSHKSVQLSGWLEKLRTVQTLLSAQGVTINLAPVLGERDAQLIVDGYFRLMRTENSLKTQYEDLASQSDEKQTECPQLRSEMESYRRQYEVAGQMKAIPRVDLEAAIALEEEKASSSLAADQKDSMLLDVYSKLSDLAKRSMQRLSFIHERTLTSPSTLFRFTQSLLTYLKKNATVAKEALTPASKPKHALRTFSLPRPQQSSYAEEQGSGPAPPFLGMPLPKIEARKLLLFAQIQHSDLYLTLYKETEIANYFTYLEDMKAAIKLGEKDGKKLFKGLLRTAYAGFGRQIKEIFEGNVKLVKEIRDAVEGLKTEVVDFYEKRGPEGRKTFEADFSRQLESADNYDSGTIKKLRRILDLRTTSLYQQYPDLDNPSEDLLPRLLKPVEEEEALSETRNLARKALLSPKVTHFPLTKSVKTIRQRTLRRNYSQESSPEGNRWHELLHTVKDSDLQIRRMKAKEAIAIHSLPPKAFLVPEWRKTQGWSVGRRGRVKSETTSPSNSAYNISIHG